MKTLFDSVDHLEGALEYHRERHAVLAGNIANLDTPGYRPLDLERIGATPEGGIALARTEAGHMAAAGVGEATLVTSDATETAGADGNAVSLERELAKVDANRVRYATTAGLVSRRLALLRYASGDGNA
jgi:flagellar basal-body rod protein FlgB